MSKKGRYWQRRAEESMLRAQEQADRRLTNIGRAMASAQSHVTEEARKIFRNYAGRFNLTEEQAAAYLAEPITRAEFDRLRAQIATMPESPEKQLLAAQVSRGAYAYRISREEALRANIAVETAKVAQVLEDETTGQLRMTAVEGYAQRMFDIQQQAGRAFAVPNIEALRVAIDTPWSGASYSADIWGNRDKLAGALEEVISSGYLSGKSHQRIAADIRDRFGVEYWQAQRLVKTETSYISNQASLKAYRDAGIEEYRYDAALDSRTCKVCGGLDGKVFAVEKADVGESLPPLHPNCRCVTVAVVEGDDTSGETRRGRDAEGKSVILPGDMNYDEWKHWQMAGAPGDVQAWLAGHRGGAERFGYSSDNEGMYRNASNKGIFAMLPERMTKKHIREVAKEMGISMKGISISIQTDSSMLSPDFPYAGCADPWSIGRIDFFPGSFQSKEELTRTLYHEKIHVEQFRKFGAEYVQNNRRYFEDLAEAAENIFIERLLREGKL